MLASDEVTLRAAKIHQAGVAGAAIGLGLAGVASVAGFPLLVKFFVIKSVVILVGSRLYASYLEQEAEAPSRMAA